MNAKRIIYGDHARRSLRARGITRQDVRWLLAKGTLTKEVTLRGDQRWGRRGYLGKHEAMVVFVEDATSQTIVSVQWLGDVGDETY